MGAIPSRPLWSRFATKNAEANYDGPMRKPRRNEKEGWGVYLGVGGALLLPLFCSQCVCVVCAREKEGGLNGLCLLFYELGLYVWICEAVHCL